MSRRVNLVLALTLVVVAAGLFPASVGAATYELSSPSAVDTPDRTVSFGGDSFDIDESARVSQGDSLVIDVTAPTDASYTVELRDSNQGYEDDADGTGSDSVTFATGSLSPGTYFAAVYADGNIQALMPVVVKGYAVSEQIPDTAEAGTSFEVSTTLTEEASAPSPNDVEVVVAEDGSENIVAQESLSEDGSMEYTGTVSVSETGEYNVYIFVRGNEEVDGENVLIGLSDPQELEVTMAEEEPNAPDSGTETPDGTDTPDETETPDDDEDDAGGGGGGAGGGGADDASTETETETETVTATATETETATSTDSQDGNGDSTTDSTSTAETMSTDDGGDTSTPADSTDPSTETTDTQLPVGALPLLFALLVVGGLAARARR